MSCYDAVQGGRAIPAGSEEARSSALPPLSAFFSFNHGKVHWREGKDEMKKIEKTKGVGGGGAFLTELITSTFLTYSLSVLLFESRFFLGETIQHVSSSCSHVYKVHICVHNVQYTLSSNLLL